MSKTIPAIAGLVTVGTIGYFATQAMVPASLRVEQQAQATIQKIQLEPDQPAQAAAAPTQAAAEQVASDKPEQLVIQRNAYLDSSITALKAEADKLLCARAAFYQQLATQKQSELGVAPEQFLMDLLSAKNQEMLTTATQTGGFSGAADLQEKGRALILDTQAIAKALQNLNQGQAPTCLAAPFQAGGNVQNYLIRAQQYRAKINEQTQALTEGKQDASSQPQK
jgi:hypothetical protein